MPTNDYFHNISTKASHDTKIISYFALAKQGRKCRRSFNSQDQDRMRRHVDHAIPDLKDLLLDVYALGILD